MSPGAAYLVPNFQFIDVPEPSRWLSCFWGAYSRLDERAEKGRSTAKLLRIGHLPHKYASAYEDFGLEKRR
jgi:hypothetical protein